jgi:hypothetical protein
MRVPRELIVQMISLTKCPFSPEEMRKMPPYQLKNTYIHWVLMEDNIAIID